MKKLALYLLCGLLPLGLMLGCDDDDDNGDNPPVTGTLTGSVIFHGDWPDSGTVQLSIFSNWNDEGAGCTWCATAAGGPPAYHTEASFFQDPDPNNLVDPDTVEFEITGITLAEYEVIVTGWRSPTQSGNIECQEPVIGMYGANPGTNDTMPDPITFSEGAPTQTIELHTWFDRRLPVPGCDDLGRIEGTIDINGDRPASGVAAIITTMPYTAWMPGGIAGYQGRYAITDPAEDYFQFSQAYGSYYVSLWTNDMPPNNRYLGAYGVNTAAGDAMPDMITISEDTPLMDIGTIAGLNPPPHYVSGTITFNGTRPAEGIAVALSTSPFLMGPPASWFPITDDSETFYANSGFAPGDYYVLLYQNTTDPGAILYGFYDADNDQSADPLTFDGSNIGYTGIDITGTAP